jgi:hypothetical protein
VMQLRGMRRTDKDQWFYFPWKGRKTKWSRAV